jgi:hypothetical protein
MNNDPAQRPANYSFGRTEPSAIRDGGRFPRLFETLSLMAAPIADAAPERRPVLIDEF